MPLATDPAGEAAARSGGTAGSAGAVRSDPDAIRRSCMLDPVRSVGSEEGASGGGMGSTGGTKDGTRDGIGQLVGRPEQAGMLIASAAVPRSFERSLMPRSAVDQGMITGLSLATEYALTTLVQDLLDLATLRLGEKRNLRRERDWRLLAAATDIAAIGVGVGVQALLRPRPGETLWRGGGRTAGWLLARSALAGFVADGLQRTLNATAETTGTVVSDRPAGRRLRAIAASIPAAIPAGAMVSGAVELWRRLRVDRPKQDGVPEAPPVAIGRSLAVGAGVSLAVTGLAAAERSMASGVGRGLARVLPGDEPEWRPVGHALALAGMATAVHQGMREVYRRIEHGEGRPEPGFEQPPESTMISGGPESLVPFSSLTREARRHVLTYIRPEWVELVMGEPAKAHPIRAYVGLDSAPTMEARIKLMLDELRRTEALDRGLLLLVSPTGTGYVNYAAIEAAEYLTRGDIATVTMQYSKRPSPMSLDRVHMGRRQNRMLWYAIHQELYARPPERRPQVVLFGESLGAHTSQDAFLHGGTLGLEVLGIDGALWIGTPYGSEWKQEVFGRRRADVDRGKVGRFNGFGQWQAMSQEARDKVRYVLVGHDDDAVTYFGPDLLLAAPPWLGPNRPAGVPRGERWSPVTTFLETLIDMKNSVHVVPGQFQSRGHDYRADLARFIRAVYRLDATQTQMDAIERALRSFERVRADWVAGRRTTADVTADSGGVAR
jgi:uncharacterized membrane protein